MIKDEFKFIGKNKLILLSVLVITLIPFLYCIFFLKSVWDPYGDTKNLPVAVVNLDQPVTYQGKKLDVGAQTLTKLKKNHQLGWHFVSEAEAKKGMKADKYYTVITLPKDFSKNAATVLDEHPKKMTLKYETNDSLNYIGQVISGIGVDSLNSEIRANVTNAYASAVFDQIKTIGNGMKTAAGAATQIDAGQVKLDDGIDQYTVAVSQVNDGVQTMKVKVAPMSSQIPKLASGANQVAGGLQTLNGSTTNLASGVNQLAAGSGQVTSGLGTLQSQTGTLKSGVGQLATGSNKVTSGLASLQSQTAPLKSGVGQLVTGSDAVTSGLDTLQSQAGLLVDGTAQLQTGSKKLTTGVKNYTQSVTTLSNGIDQLASSTSSLDNGTKALVTGSSQVTQGLQQVGKSVDSQNQQAAASLPKLQNTLTEYEAKLKSEPNQNPELIAGFEQIQASVNALISQTQTNGAKMATTLNQSLIPGSEELTNGLTTLNQQVPTLTAAIIGLQSGSKQIIANNDQLVTGANNLTDGIGQMATQTPSLVRGVDQLYTGSSQVSGGLSTLNHQVPVLTSGVNQLYAGSNQVSGGLGSLNNQVPALTSGINQLYTGSSQVSGGLGTLNGQVPTLTNGVGQLTNGASQVAGGVNQLNASVPTLVSGVNQLADGTGQINDKSDTLKSGSSQLEDGDKKFAKTLTSSARKVNGITLTGDTAKMFAAPTKTAQKHYSYVPNYGHALAPYVLSLALYVGALVFNFAYPIRKVSRADGTATQWFLSKVAIGGAVALGTAVLEATLMMATGLKVDNIGLFYLTAILFSFTSMYLIMFLSMAFDNPGRFVAMVGLMLQLGGAGGTFPMEITNQFYNAIHPFLPMTYSIMNFRNALTGGIADSTVTLGFMVLIAFTIGSLLLLWGTMILLQRHHLMGISQLDDNQKLQAVEK
ncbi:YhgE/Pip domain-containing protein [Lacticaseibacillus paracasei]|jgi:putative membrane protein|uniref:Integral membrane protein n=1 Tax=Lacticaseibacillus paracasei subsp. paracasei Lpp14 TaxID=1256204 RepID=A0A829GMH2_LACPA|nr:YhgE/Pip domain-containing protein [Lacticaseibacillus paracasei]EPC59663.1 Putative integral membrane protein [Lacticaseibacillus paracasei subsp. paracasei Lpp14]MDN5967297.1 YhgE/Pip domain-containing protein [Lacticaseibacillus paracasei]MDN6006647.1 YhgE/Pip domain-containing protein [Lacticaseibacillus paracasei]MDN6432271.1 YhgE/Pip domain-containing protein [Lacticaseibacillus paracasei]MDN6766825.1 YhgE/Pip domain-containing protein [Lacticaseibacillus paracasei]